jgi:2-C-methyl-D-erythritol 4-phosphate cytidylyltransferase
MPASFMPRLFALIPAAGTGSRMGAARPKQYLPLAGKPVLYHALRNLCRHTAIDRVFVVLAPGDTFFAEYDWTEFGPRLMPLFCGGEARPYSVFNGLLAVRDEIGEDDWVLVHDAVRPCLALETIERLIETVRSEPTGGLLALPAVDTMKRGDAEGYVLQTEAREHLWQAQTPQMFRYGVLARACAHPAARDCTDEAQAIEAQGLAPRLVRGSAANLKVTFPDDLHLAAAILASQATLESAR